MPVLTALATWIAQIFSRELLKKLGAWLGTLYAKHQENKELAKKEHARKEGIAHAIGKFHEAKTAQEQEDALKYLLERSRNNPS